MEHHVNGFLKYLTIENNTSQNTNIKYKADLTKLSSFLESEFNITEPTEIQTSHLRSYLEHIKEHNNLAPSSVGNKIAVIKSFFNYLHMTEAINKNPASQLKSPRVNQKLPKFLNDIELEKLLFAPDRSTKMRHVKFRIRDKLILTLLAYTGIRKSELLNRDWQDVNLGQKYIIIRNSKNKVDRTVPLHDTVIKLLYAYLTLRLPLTNNALFIGERKDKRLAENSLDNLFKYYLKISGLSDKGYSIHSLRHTFATRLLNKNVNLFKIKTLLGHKSIESTEIYLHVTNKGLEDSINLL